MRNSIYLLIAFSFVSHCFSMDITKKPTLYLDLCAEFWDLDKPTPPRDEYAFFRQYVVKSSGPILEPMCGSGRYLIPLLEEGFKVEGLDSSSFMLKRLHKKCAEKKLCVNAWEQFLEVVPETKQYNLIFIPDTSFCIFLDTEHIKKCLKKIYSLLLPGGTFVLDLQTEHSRAEHQGMWGGKAYKKDDGNMIIESVLPLPVVNCVLPLILRYELMDSTGILKTQMEHYQIKLYQQGEMDALLKEVGFKHIKRMKAYDRKRSPFMYDSYIVYECKK